tara:strand:- start:321 stop:917 length:597 start_codon:yes stop_codon:yes gene_type:complete
MTPQDIITEVRYLINDTNILSSGYRQSDTELLSYVNGALKECAVLQPSYYASIGDVACTAGQCEQGIEFSDAAALLEVLGIHEGAVLTPFDLAAMNAYNPGWKTDTAAAARQWSRFPNDPLKFYVYPKAPATSQVLDVRYVRVPEEFALTETITELPNVLQSALVNYVVFRAESKNDESVATGRATAFYQAFLTLVKG